MKRVEGDNVPEQNPESRTEMLKAVLDFLRFLQNFKVVENRRKWEFYLYPKFDAQPHQSQHTRFNPDNISSLEGINQVLVKGFILPHQSPTFNPYDGLTYTHTHKIGDKYHLFNGGENFFQISINLDDEPLIKYSCRMGNENMRSFGIIKAVSEKIFAKFPENIRLQMVFENLGLAEIFMDAYRKMNLQDTQERDFVLTNPDVIAMLEKSHFVRYLSENGFTDFIIVYHNYFLSQYFERYIPPDPNQKNEITPVIFAKKTNKPRSFRIIIYDSRSLTHVSPISQKI